MVPMSDCMHDMQIVNLYWTFVQAGALPALPNQSRQTTRGFGCPRGPERRAAGPDPPAQQVC